jgi:hypothetical protein
LHGNNFLIKQNLLILSLLLDDWKNLFESASEILTSDELIVLNPAIYVASITTVGVFGQRFSSKSELSYNMLESFLISPNKNLISSLALREKQLHKENKEQEAVDPQNIKCIVRKFASSYASLILKTFKTLDEISSLTLMRFVNILCSSDSNSDEELVANICSLVGRIIILMPSGDQPATSLLIKYFSELYDKFSISLAILNCLGDLAETVDLVLFKDIINAYSWVSKQTSFDVSLVQLSDEIIRNQFQIAKSLVEPSKRCVFIENILALFIDKASIIYEEEDSSFDDKELICLLLIIYEASDKFFDLAPSESTLLLLRNAWAYCILLGSDRRDGRWKLGWKRAVTLFAIRTPFLILPGNRNFLDIELTSSYLKESARAKKDLKLLISNMNSLFPQKADLIRNLSITQCLFLLTIYHVETLTLLKLHRLGVIYDYCAETLTSSFNSLVLSIMDKVNALV